MDYSLITEDKIRARMRSLSPDITDLLNSQIATRTVERIGREHSMDAERVEMLQQLVGLVLLGFLSTEILAEEINENLRLNHRHSQEVTKDLESRVFEQVSKDLEKLYEPLADLHSEAPLEKSEEERREKKLEIRKDTIYLEKLGPEPVRPPSSANLPALPAQARQAGAMAGERVKLSEEHKKDKGYGEVKKKKMDDGGEKPLILHEEKLPSAVSKKRRRPLGSLSFSLGRFFNKEEGKEKGETPVPKAEVEIPVIKKDRGQRTEDKTTRDKKIVHYSEHRTSFGRSAPKEELMNLSKLRALSPPKEKMEPELKKEKALEKTTAKTRAPEKHEVPRPSGPPANLPMANDKKEKNEGKGVSIEGNTVDLR